MSSTSQIHSLLYAHSILCLSSLIVCILISTRIFRRLRASSNSSSNQRFPTILFAGWISVMFYTIALGGTFFSNTILYRNIIAGSLSVSRYTYCYISHSTAWCFYFGGKLFMEWLFLERLHRPFSRTKHAVDEPTMKKFRMAFYALAVYAVLIATFLCIDVRPYRTRPRTPGLFICTSRWKSQRVLWGNIAVLMPYMFGDALFQFLLLMRFVNVLWTLQNTQVGRILSPRSPSSVPNAAARRLRQAISLSDFNGDVNAIGSSNREGNEVEYRDVIRRNTVCVFVAMISTIVTIVLLIFRSQIPVTYLYLSAFDCFLNSTCIYAMFSFSGVFYDICCCPCDRFFVGCYGCSCQSSHTAEEDKSVTTLEPVPEENTTESTKENTTNQTGSGESSPSYLRMSSLTESTKHRLSGPVASDSSDLDLKSGNGVHRFLDALDLGIPRSSHSESGEVMPSPVPSLSHE